MFAEFQRGILKIAEQNSRKAWQKPLSRIFLSTFVDAVRTALIEGYGEEWTKFFIEADEELDFTVMNDAVRKVITDELLCLGARAEFTAVNRHEAECVVSNDTVHAITDAVIPVLTEEAHEIQAAADEAAAQETEAA